MSRCRTGWRSSETVRIALQVVEVNSTRLADGTQCSSTRGRGEPELSEGGVYTSPMDPFPKQFGPPAPAAWHLNSVTLLFTLLPPLVTWPRPGTLIMYIVPNTSFSSLSLSPTLVTSPPFEGKGAGQDSTDAPRSPPLVARPSRGPGRHRHHGRRK